MRILVIEDDADIARAIATMLARARYSVDVAADGDAGLERLLSGAYDLAIVDVGLPERDGFTICRNVRAEGMATPLLLLTARDAIEDRIAGLDAGADDYLVKPFSEAELAARLRALLRRADRAPERAALEIGSLRIDTIGRTASLGGKPIELGVTEFRLLELLVRNRGMTLSRAQILERIWEYDFDGSSNIVDVYIGRLRRKFAARACDVAIETVWAVGYKLVENGSKRERSSA